VPTYRADLEYDGTRYRGWQVQENARSVAGELQRAIVAAGGDLRELGGSGRTDAGVHALSQTAHLRLGREVDAERLRLAINDALPPDIHVRLLLRAREPFHARHDALSRSYLYQIARQRTAFAKRFVWWVRRPLDTGRMVAAARGFVGRHDFRWFCEAPARQAGTLVVVDGVELAERGDLILIRFTASHYLWKMVRRIVGTLVRVGAGELAVEAPASWLADEVVNDPGTARWTAPPSGLFLERVVYPGEPPPAPLEPAFGLGPVSIAPEVLWLGSDRPRPRSPERGSGPRRPRDQSPKRPGRR